MPGDPDACDPGWQHIAGALGPPKGAYDADIVILALDRPEETMAAIRSAQTQLGVSKHVTVVDQGSRPDALTCLVNMISGCSDTTLLSAGRNLGVPGGRNRGTAAGHGRVIVGLDNDAVFDTAFTVAAMVAAIDDNPNLAAIGVRIVIHSTGEDDLSSWGYPAALLCQAGQSFDAVTFVGAGHAIRRAAWDMAGGYDERLFFCWEEYDFCLRAVSLGWSIQYHGAILVRHKVSPERRVTWAGDRWFHFVRNRLYIARKHGASWISLLPRMLGYVLKSARNGCLRDTPSAILAAYRLARDIQPRSLPQAARDYVDRADTTHRGTWLARLRRDVLSALPGTTV